MYFDLEHKVRTDGEFRHLLQKKVRLVEDLRIKLDATPSAATPLSDAQWDLIQFCNFNLAFLAPLYFPRYPKDKPLSFVNYPYAFQMFSIQVGGFTVFKGSRQVAKSTSLAARQIMMARMLPNFASLYLCPRRQYLNTYSNRLRDVDRAHIHYRPDHSLRNNLHLKEFASGSRIELIYVLSSAANARSKSTDELLYDEVQDFDPDLELEVEQVQSASEMPIKIYAGTSITTDTMLEAKWDASSQGVWVTTCDGCRTDNIPLPDFKVLDMIQPAGPSCVKCGKLLNILAGRFVHTYGDRLEQKKVGFHIPQLIVPAVLFNQFRWAEICEKKHSQDPRKFFQEILGIATETGERELTRAHLQALCVLGSDVGALEKKAAGGGYQFVISACDWGGSDYIPAENMKVSTTVHVMLGISPLGQIDIVHMRRYSGMDYDDISDSIIAHHKRMGGFAIATDFGVGAVYNSRIRQKLPLERHLIFNYVGPESALMAEPAKEHLYNQWSLNKTESLSLTFEALRKGRIRCYNWELAQAMLTDCLNIYRAPGEKSGTGASTFIYRGSASKPNDTLMALNYGFMLAKILLGEPMFADLSTRIRVESALKSPLANITSVGSQMPRAFSR